MAELQERDTKLIQYLNEAYGKEKELETSLQAHIQLTTRDAYKKRLKDHLRETKQQAKGLQRRIKQLGGKAEAVPIPGPDAVAEAAGAVTSLAGKAVAATKGPLHAVRGTSEQEVMLKNAKTEYWNEAEEIANYNAIETLAEAVGDKETAKLARQYRREEERMASFLDRTIPQLTKDVARAEIPASQRNGGRRRRGGARSARPKAAAKTAAKSSASKTGSAKAAKASAASSKSARSTAKGRTTKAASKSRSTKGTSKPRSAAKSRGASGTGRSGGSGSRSKSKS